MLGVTHQSVLDQLFKYWVAEYFPPNLENHKLSCEE